jgi:prepilin-type N-terminal cleavage/methylation domain-containing protein
MRSTDNKGFTIVELVVVIAILGILVAVAIPKYVEMTTQAKKAADDGYLAGLRSATLMLYASNIVAGTTNSVGTYWPTMSQASNQMSDTYTWRYYTNTSYNPTSGVWSVLP